MMKTIEVNKNLLLSAIFEGVEVRNQARDWDEVRELCHLLLLGKFEEIKARIK